MTITKRSEVKIGDLPNPTLLSDPRNLEYLEEFEDDLSKKKKTKASKRKSGADDDDVEEIIPSPATKKAKTKRNGGIASSSQSTSPTSLFDIQLNGDEDESVPIYDSCDEVRKKINKYLRGSKITNAAFLRDIARAGWPSDPPKIQSKQLNDFLSYKGATTGSTSRVFYGAYVFFEKMRITEGKPKSAHRKQMEREWKQGFPRHYHGGWLRGPADKVPVEDSLGRVSWL